MANIIKKILDTDTDIIEYISDLSIDDLELTINYAADKYYNKNPIISDAIYDILIDFLRLKDPKSKVLKNVGAKVKAKNKVELDYWLGSMEKIKPPSNDLNNWMKKYKPPYNLSDKLDGISALLIYDYNKKIKLYTRGTATEGLDISHLIKYLGLPSYNSVYEYCKKNNIEGQKNLIAFRGELIMSEKLFNDNWSNKFKNARNTIAGLVNSKKINPELALDTDLVLYEVVDPFDTIDKQLNIIKALKFNYVYNKTINSVLTFEYLSNLLIERRENNTYLVDGIIVTSATNKERNTKGNPDYAFAFKDILEDQITTTTILDIEWNISKDGYIKPTLLLKPVTIGGVEIKRATGNNARFVVDNKLGIGAEIELIRSGDVIPKVLKVIKAGKVVLPKGDWEWNASQVDIKIKDMKDNIDVLIKNIYHFFSTLETKGLGEKNIEKLVKAELNTIPKIIKASKDDFLKVEGFKEKTATNLINSIKTSLSEITLAKLMSASNKLGHGIGEERMKQVLNIYPNLLIDYSKWSKNEFINKLKDIEGWEEKTSTLLVSNFNEFIKFYNSIKDYITFEVKKVIKGKFTDMIIVFSGFRDNELQSKIEKQGGIVKDSFTKNTDYLIVKDDTIINNPTEKVKKAMDNNIKILTKDELIKML